MSRISVAILLILLTAAVAVFLILPQWRDVGELGSGIGELQSLHAELAGIAESRDALLAEYNAIPEADLAKLRAVAPAGQGTAGGLADFEALAARRGLELTQVDFTPGSNAAPGAIALPASPSFGTIPISLTLRGSYENFRGFLQDLEHNLRLVDVNEMTFSASQSKESPLMVKGVIYYRR